MVGAMQTGWGSRASGVRWLLAALAVALASRPGLGSFQGDDW